LVSNFFDETYESNINIAKRKKPINHDEEDLDVDLYGNDEITDNDDDIEINDTPKKKFALRKRIKKNYKV
jgi:hypothetical protein